MLFMDYIENKNNTNATVITFHTIEDGLIVKQKEFWPDSFEPPLWRRKWMKII